MLQEMVGWRSEHHSPELAARANWHAQPRRDQVGPNRSTFPIGNLNFPEMGEIISRGNRSMRHSWITYKYCTGRHTNTGRDQIQEGTEYRKAHECRKAHERRKAHELMEFVLWRHNSTSSRRGI
jgi:hypothetical protein